MYCGPTRATRRVYVSAVGYLRRMGARARRRLGRAVHDAGGATRADVRALQAEIQQLRDAVSAGGVGLDGLTAVVNNLGRARTDDLARLARIDVLLAVETFSRFIRHARLRTKPLVSVVLPTYNRPERLVRAIQSVAAQRYENWELIVVDDGGDTAWPATQVSDPRVRSLRLEHGGVCAARNAGLARARGEIIGYLDDDNVMDPDWLYAVVWAFERRPEVDVLYGAFVIDDVQRVTGGASSRELPRTFLHPWDRMALERGISPTSARWATEAGWRTPGSTSLSRRWATGTCC